MVIEQYKTGFVPPDDLPFEDLSVIGTSVSSGSTSTLGIQSVKGTMTGKTKKRTGFRALFNTSKVFHFSFLV